MWKFIKRFKAQYPVRSEFLIALIGTVVVVVVAVMMGLDSPDVLSIVFFPWIGGSMYFLRKYIK